MSSRAPVLAAVVLALAFPGAAAAAVTGTHTVATSFRSAGLELTGYAAGDAVSLSVTRNGVPVGTAAGTAGADGILDINPGGCWDVFTPEILAGDTVSVTGVGFTDSMVVQNLTVEPPVQALDGDVIVTGTAAAAPGGGPVAAATLGVRIIGGDKFSNGKRALRAGAGGTDGTLAYDTATLAFTATFPVSGTDATMAMAPVETRAVWANAAANETTIAANAPATGAAPLGPSAPCTAPLARNAVTGVDAAHQVGGRSVVDAGNAGTDLVLSGVAQPDATAVAVTFGGLSYAATPAAGAWSVSVPAADLAALPDGTIAASATYATPGGTLTGVNLDVLKDTVAPAPPTSSPAPGTYATSQSVALGSDDPTATVRFARGTRAWAGSPVFGTPLNITGTQTVHAVAVDAAGNASPEATFAYVIAPAAGGRSAGGPGPAVKAPSSAAALANLRLRRSQTLRGLRADGLSVAIDVGVTTPRVRFTLLRRSGRRLKAVRTLTRPAGRPGTYRYALRAGALGLARRGSYVLRAAPGVQVSFVVR